MEYKVSQAVCTGTRHQTEGLPCQDRTGTERGGDVICCALADGAGSRSSSEVGAACVTQFVSGLFCQAFEALWAMEDCAVARRIVELCCEALARQTPPIYDLACTLLFYAAHRDGRFLAGHLGDGIMILEQSGQLSVFSPPENGTYHNETFFITGEDAAEHLRIRRGIRTQPGTLLMMSDGTAESLYHYATQTPAPACRILAQWLREGDEDAVSGALRENMEQIFSSHTGDDMSLILLNWQESSAPPGEQLEDNRRELE